MRLNYSEQSNVVGAASADCGERNALSSEALIIHWDDIYAHVNPDLVAELAAWDVASDEALALVERDSAERGA